MKCQKQQILPEKEGVGNLKATEKSAPGAIQKTAKQQKTSNNLDIWRKVRQWQDNNGKTHRTLKLPISLPFFAFGLVPFLDLDCWIDFGF